MFELWILKDFKDKNVLNILEVSACPDVLENSQKLEISFHPFQLVMLKVLVLLFIFLFSVFIRTVCFLFRPCQRISRVLPDHLVYNFCNLHHLSLRLLERSREWSDVFNSFTPRLYHFLGHSTCLLIIPWAEWVFISSVRIILRISSYATHKLMGMTHLCSALINRDRTFQKGHRGRCLTGYRGSDSLPLPQHQLNYSSQVNNCANTFKGKDIK